MVFASHSAPLTISKLLALNKRLYEELLISFEVPYECQIFIFLMLLLLMLSFCLISCCLAPRVRSWGSNERKEVSNAWQPRNPRGTWKTWFEGFFLLSGSENSPNTRCANNTRNSLKPSVNYFDENEEVGREGGGKRKRFPFCIPKMHWGCTPDPEG